jgi:uncharacterized protein with PIN domain
MHDNTAHFRFYEELNDFLPPEKKKVSFSYSFNGNPSVKDSIEAIGIPHPEVDLVLVNGESVAFNYQVQNGDRVSVYPVFESIDISPVIHLRPEPLRDTKFILDVHLGKLAKLLRMLGFDSLYSNEYEDAEIVAVAVREHRIILTCDRGLLKHGAVTHGYCVRSRDTNEQLQEIINRFDLSGQIKPFYRCSACNGLVKTADKETIRNKLEPKTAEYYDRFFMCSACGKIYWEGSHFNTLSKKIETILKNST